jgi:4-hydroxy-2-oxoheptanedioate aldolase
MNDNWVRQKLLKGEPTIGCQMGLCSPHVAELLSHAGYEWIIIEMEHNALDYAEVEHILMAISSADTIPIVRVPSSDQVYIQRALDVGGMGILVPMVRTPEEAQAIVNATRYPPDGVRGLGGLRATRYMADNSDYLARANDHILVAIILETKEAVENLEVIVSVPGIDVLYIGLWDLCASYGLDPMKMPHAEMDEVVEYVLRVGRERGVAIGITTQDLREALERGITMLGYGPDYRMLLQAAQAGINTFRDLQVE